MQKVMDEYKAKGYERMIGELRAGPPKYFRVGPMATLNVVENWIHHEDMRRANGQGPRPPDPEVDEILWTSLKTSSFMAKRKLKGAGAAQDARRARAAGEAGRTLRRDHGRAR